MPFYQTIWVMQMVQMVYFRVEKVGISIRGTVQEIIKEEGINIIVVHLSTVVHNAVEQQILVTDCLADFLE